MTGRDRRITLAEAAERLGVHYMTAYRYVRTGRLPAERDGVQWMVDVRELERMRSPGPAPRRRGAARKAVASDLAARMVAGDEPGAWALVEATLASGAEPADIHLELLGPALRSIGDRWATGELGVADEHRAAAVAQRLIGRLGPRFARRGRKRGTVVVGAPPGESHGLPCAMLADLLRGVGFEVADLGADTPAASFADTCRRATRLVAVALGATTPGNDDGVASVVRAVRDAGVSVPVLVGGAAIDDEEHAARLGADGWSGHDGRAAMAAIERAVSAR